MKSVMFIAGEASGDANAAELVKALRARDPQLEVFGAGGPKMQAAGMELLLDFTEHAVVGFVEVLKNYGKFKRIFDQLLAEADRRRPGAVVLVDFPGFNLRIAATLKQRGIKVIYYISPQLWAWHASRAKQIERDIALMLVIFPFEKTWYSKNAPRLRCEFVGHPMLDRFADRQTVGREPRTVLLLPGSREREVAKIFPILAAVAEQLPADVECVAAAVNDATAAMMQHPRVRVEVGKARDWMQRATLAITASGTATMECAFFGCPMLIVYKVNWLNYLLGRLLIQVNWLGMPNVIANATVVPEFIQQDAQPARIVLAARELLSSKANRQAMQAQLAGVVRELGEPGGGKRAADLIYGEISP